MLCKRAETIEVIPGRWDAAPDVGGQPDRCGIRVSGDKTDQDFQLRFQEGGDLVLEKYDYKERRWQHFRLLTNVWSWGVK